MNSCTRRLKLIIESVETGILKATAQCAHNSPTLTMAGNTLIEFQPLYTGCGADKSGFTLHVSKLMARLPLYIMSVVFT